MGNHTHDVPSHSHTLPDHLHGNPNPPNLWMLIDLTGGTSNQFWVIYPDSTAGFITPSWGSSTGMTPSTLTTSLASTNSTGSASGSTGGPSTNTTSSSDPNPASDTSNTPGGKSFSSGQTEDSITMSGVTDGIDVPHLTVNFLVKI